MRLPINKNDRQHISLQKDDRASSENTVAYFLQACALCLGNAQLPSIDILSWLSSRLESYMMGDDKALARAHGASAAINAPAPARRGSAYRRKHAGSHCE